MPLVLMTDERKADWAAAARLLPRGSVVVVRGRDTKKRLALAESLHGIAPLLISDDPALAARIGATGLHLPEARMRHAAHWRAAFPHWIITSSAHSLRALMGAHLLDAVFLSPVFATTSHGNARPLTPVRAAFIAAHAPVPVYALGGVTAQNVALLAPAFSGIAAISSLIA
ncbi:MAG: thiamine phosphate synthase [Alphaproteobacteria bacterium]|nr:thiamine phosphate synthase [Alphaproteobacteria bacterium]